MGIERYATTVDWVLGIVLIASCLGVLFAKKPVHASLYFMLALLTISGLYLQLDAEFIATMQILVYAGAILVIFMFVIVLFQDAHGQIDNFRAQSKSILLALGSSLFLFSMVFVWVRLVEALPAEATIPERYGSVHDIGKALYFDFFFPFEAVILIFLVAIVGSLYIAKKEKI